MKYIFIATLLITGMPSGYAQHAFKATQRQQGNQGVINWLLQPQREENAAMKTTTGISSERVVAQSRKDNNLGSLTDSVNLIYGINRGSAYDYNNMLYAYNYPYSVSPMFNYAGAFTKPRVLFDTFRRWTVDPNTLVYGYYETDYAGYDSHLNTTSYKELYRDSAFYPNMNFINRFNSANNIDSAYAFNWIAGVSDSAFKQFFTYNSFNKITKDSTYEYHGGVWRIVSRSLYTYNITNDLVQIDNYANTTDTSFLLPLIEQLQYINTYDASHRLLTVASSYYTGTSFGPYVRDTFGYSGSLTYHNSWREYQYDPINAYWAPMFNMTKNTNLAMLPDTVTINSFDSILNAWVPQTMDVIHYNLMNDPDTLKDYEYNFTAFPLTPDFQTIYYYQTYLNTTHIKPASPESGNNALIFPNPATDMLTITQLNAAMGAKISVIITNVSGQLITRETMTWQGSQQLSVANLLPGAYSISIYGGRGEILHTQTFIKQ
jgi:hypothetical protein